MRSGAVCERGDRSEISREAEAGRARATESVGQAQVQRQDPVRPEEGEPAAVIHHNAESGLSSYKHLLFSSPDHEWM
jgi:hypothetical protein